MAYHPSAAPGGARRKRMLILVAAIGAAVAVTSIVAFAALPSQPRNQALDCWENEFRMVESDRDRIESWMDRVEELGISWTHHECNERSGALLFGEDESADHVASVQAYSGYVPDNVRDTIVHEIQYQCSGPYGGPPVPFVRDCLAALGDQDYLDIYDEHEPDLAEPEASITLEFEPGAKFRDWRTSILLRTFGVFVRHYR